MNSASRAAVTALLSVLCAAGQAGSAPPRSEAQLPGERLLLERADGLAREGRFYEARHVLREGARSVPGVAVLKRLAEVEDVSGTSAAEVYAALAGKMEGASPRQEDFTRVLERGLEVSLRENNPKCAAFFRSRLRRPGDLAAAALPNSTRSEAAPPVVIRGGVDALSALFRFKAAAPGRIIAQYCQAIRNATADDRANAIALKDLVRRYFQLVASLEALGRREGRHVRVTVPAADRSGVRQASRVLDLLGLELHAGREGSAVNAGERASQAQRQQLSSALAIDTVGLQDAVESGRGFTFELVDDEVPVLFGEAVWQAAFYPGESLPGGFAEFLAREPAVAKLYAGLAKLDPKTRAALAGGVPLPSLEKHAELLYDYGSALGMDAGRANLPGGEAAAQGWTALAGASPTPPGPFFRALLEKDQGKLVAFYSTLCQLDHEHQRYFTRTAARLAAFYGLFRESIDMRFGARRRLRSTPFLEFLRDVPLRDDGTVRFPGGASAWAGPGGPRGEADDEILLRLARTRYSAQNVETSLSDNFLAVVRIEGHRSEPLDEASVELLSRHYREAAGVYPYFASLTGLQGAHFRAFFGLLPAWQGLPPARLNDVLGEFHALTKLLCLGQDSGALPPQRAAGLFGTLCSRFASATSDGDYAAASLAVVSGMLRDDSGRDAADHDRALERMLFGDAPPAVFALNGAAYRVNALERRTGRFRKVLDAQRAPALEPLLTMAKTAAEAAREGPDARRLHTLELCRDRMPDWRIPAKAALDERHNLRRFEPERVRRIVARFRAGRDPKKLERELLSSLQPHVQIALAGIVYAYYLAPEDLVISEDASFLRRHKFVEDSAPAGLFPDSYFHTGAAGGSYLSGGFADFSFRAGQLAAVGSRFTNGSQSVFAAQVGSIRALDWGRLHQDDLRVLGLRIRQAREWIVACSLDPGLCTGLEEATRGLLSPGRRTDLLEGIRGRDWDAVWESVTLSDLYFLSERYTRRYAADPRPSPVTAELRRLLGLGRGSGLPRLGPIPGRLLGCGHAHLVPLPPYEEFENLFFPFRVAERAAEFALYLAEVADRAGVPPHAAGAVGEEALRGQMKKVRMTDPWDWRAVLNAYGAFGEESLEALLGHL